MCPVVANIVTDERLHSHRIVTEHAYSASSGSGCLRGNSGTHVGAVYPVEGLIYQRSCGSTSAAEDDSAYRNAVRVVELRRYAGAVYSRSGESGVRVSKLLVLAGSGVDLRSELNAVYLCALPLCCINRRILIKAFPPNGVVCVVQSNVGEDGVLHGGSQCVVVGLSVSTRCYAEEAVLGVDSVQSAVLAGLHPGNIVAYGEYLVALLLIYSRRNQHCEVGLAASRRECSSDILHLAIGLLNAEDQHVLSHPALVLALVGSDTQCEALLAQQNVSAVCGVDGPDRVLLRELNDISLLGINVSLAVQTANEVVGGVAEVLESVSAHSGHDVHVQDNVDGVGQLNAYLSERGADRAHGVRDNVHGSALHNAVVHRGQHSLHFLRIHPVVGGACVLLLTAADESSVLNSCNVVGECSVIQAAGELLRVQSVHLVLIAVGQGANLVGQLGELLLGAVDPYDLIRLGKSYHLVYPLDNVRVLG